MPAEFQTPVRFYRECNGDGSSTWLFSHDKVQTVYYYNTCDPDKKSTLERLLRNSLFDEIYWLLQRNFYSKLLQKV